MNSNCNLMKLYNRIMLRFSLSVCRFIWGTDISVKLFFQPLEYRVQLCNSRLPLSVFHVPGIQPNSQSHAQNELITYTWTHLVTLEHDDLMINKTLYNCQTLNTKSSKRKALNAIQVRHVPQYDADLIEWRSDEVLVRI